MFKIEKKLKGGLGRAGILETQHGIIHTPAFAPVGTNASIKSLTPEQIKSIGAEIIICNTYHLYLQPGDELISKTGGLGKFMNWQGPTMTDSGGFQVFSLGVAYGKGISKVTKITDPSLLLSEFIDDNKMPKLAKIGEDGVSFISHRDGSVHYFTPEKSIQAQHNIGADIIFSFDECTAPIDDLRYQEQALSRTHRWAERSLNEHLKLKALSSSLPKSDLGDNFPFLFGIVQGGRNEDLRKKSAKFIGDLNFDGFGIGGSFAKEDIADPVKWANEILPENKPRHLLGIGEPEDIFLGVENGADLFDCVLPTRNARNGSLYTSFGKISIMNNKYRNDFDPIEINCKCYTCQSYSKAYISHLFHTKEILSTTLASIHNLYFFVSLLKKIRQSIIDDKFFEFKEYFFTMWNKK